MSKTYVAIDVSNLAYRASWANKELTTSTGKFSGHVFGAVASILAMLRNELAGQDVRLCFCYDGKNSKDYRRTILPEYKAHRIPSEINPLPEVAEVLKLWPDTIHIDQVDKEGDDAIAYCVRMREGRPVVVWSGDKDLWSLLQYPNVRVLSPNLKRFVENSDLMEHYHLDNRPGNVYLAKALFGDASDGIKGVFRLQKKQVAPILNTPGVCTVTDFYNAIAIKPDCMTASTHQKLKEAVDKVVINYQVVLPQVDFQKQSVEFRGGNFTDLKQKLIDYECYSLLNLLS
jgi:5'-3' exonuclease